LGRYTGPVEKLSRREGVELYLKGERLAAGKGALERRPYPPGQHGRARRRQFRRYFERARRESGVAGENLLRHLERRLDNVIYRLGFATTRAQARQFLVHGHILVNGRRVDRPSFEVRPGDVITLRPGAAVEPAVRRATELTTAVPDWLIADHDGLSGRAERLPEREDIPVPVNEQLIVELYSR